MPALGRDAAVSTGMQAYPAHTIAFPLDLLQQPQETHTQGTFFSGELEAWSWEEFALSTDRADPRQNHFSSGSFWPDAIMVKAMIDPGPVCSVCGLS